MTMRLQSPYDRLLAPVYVPSLLMAVSQEALTILLPLYVIELGSSAAFAAWIVFLRGFGILLFDVPAGMLVARFGDKPVLLGGLALLLAGLATLGLTANPWALGIASIALGSGHAAWMLGRQSYLADVCARHELGRAIAAMAGLQRGGALLGPVAGGTIAASAGYPTAFIVGAASAVVAGALVIAFARDVESHVPTATSASRGRSACSARSGANSRPRARARSCSSSCARRANCSCRCSASSPGWG